MASVPLYRKSKKGITYIFAVSTLQAIHKVQEDYPEAKTLADVERIFGQVKIVSSIEHIIGLVFDPAVDQIMLMNDAAAMYPHLSELSAILRQTRQLTPTMVIKDNIKNFKHSSDPDLIKIGEALEKELLTTCKEAQPKSRYSIFGS